MRHSLASQTVINVRLEHSRLLLMRRIPASVRIVLPVFTVARLALPVVLCALPVRTLLQRGPHFAQSVRLVQVALLLAQIQAARAAAVLQDHTLCN
jgi:hypothetical protein